jgi:long-chain acyl-CoA synthetase
MMPNLGFGKEVVLATAPLYHISGMNAVLNPAIGLGATLILVERFEAENVARLCERYSVSYTVGVPTIFFALADYLERASVDWSSLKCAVSGGGYLPESIKTRFENVTKSRLLQAYGLTECSPGVAMPSMSYEDPVGSCGRVLPSTEVQIRSLLDPSIVLPVGEVGEICVRGPQVTPGYWGRDEENKKAFIQGFLRTGDVGRLTEDGVLFLVDRLKEIIICSGFNVYPGLIEEVIFLHPSVSEAIVIGVPDQYRGETVKAFVVLKPGTSLDLQELQTFLRPYVSPVEMPKQLEIRASLPRSEVGKLSRHKLREEIARVI